MKKIIALALVVMVMVGTIWTAAYADNGEALEQALHTNGFERISDNLWVIDDAFNEDGIVTVNGSFYPEEGYGYFFTIVKLEHFIDKYFTMIYWNGSEIVAGPMNEVE